MKIDRFAAAFSIVELFIIMTVGWIMFHWKGAALAFLGAICIWWGFVFCAEKPVEVDDEPEHDSCEGCVNDLGGGHCSANMEYDGGEKGDESYKCWRSKD